MIADIEVDVRIAAHDDVRAVLLAGLKHLLGEVARAGAAAARAVGAVVALEQDVALLGSLGNLVEVDREARIVRMADDLDLRDPHGAHDGRRVVEFRTRIDAGVVQASDGVVDGAQCLLLKVDLARRVQDVELHAHEEFHAGFLAVDLAVKDAQVLEVEAVRRARHGRCVVGDANECEPLLAARCDHLADRVVGMAAGQRVHVDVE